MPGIIAAGRHLLEAEGELVRHGRPVGGLPLGVENHRCGVADHVIVVGQAGIDGKQHLLRAGERCRAFPSDVEAWSDQHGSRKLLEQIWEEFRQR